MSQPRTIALDAMGGDHGPSVVVPGAALSLERYPTLSFIFYGDEPRIRAELDKLPALAAKSRIVHTDMVVNMSDKPSQALRRGKGTSLWLAIEAVHKGDADVAVSAGNTGAFMAMSKLILRPMSGIERPAIAALWPTVKAECIVLDVGANIGASARELGDFALMGAAMARALFHIERPTVGLLNVGVEEIKGVEEVRQAHAWLKSTELPLDYRGFIEGDQIGQGVVDVVVVEGFAGNIALKTAEGTAKQISEYLRAAMQRSWVSKLGRFARLRRLPRAQRKDGPPAGQRRHVSWPQRHRGQEFTGARMPWALPAPSISRTRWPRAGSFRGLPPTWRRSTTSSRRSPRAEAAGRHSKPGQPPLGGSSKARSPLKLGQP